MNNEAPIKSVIITGNSKSQITYKLHPDTEFSQGVWYISVSSLAYSSNIELNELFSVSCNLVKSHRIVNNYEVQCYEQPFGMFLLKSPSKNVINFGDSKWLYINALSNELKITIQKLESEDPLKADCDFYIHLLFKRVK